MTEQTGSKIFSYIKAGQKLLICACMKSRDAKLQIFVLFLGVNSCEGPEVQCTPNGFGGV